MGPSRCVPRFRWQVSVAGPFRGRFPRLTFFAMKHLSPMDWGSMTIVGLRNFSVPKTMRMMGKPNWYALQCIWYICTYTQIDVVNVGTYSSPKEHFGKVSAKNIKKRTATRSFSNIPSDEVFDQIKWLQTRNFSWSSESPRIFRTFQRSPVLISRTTQFPRDAADVGNCVSWHLGVCHTR